MIDIKIKKNTVTGTLNQMQKAGEDLTPMMKVLGQTGVSKIKLGFRAGQAPGGGSWESLKARAGSPLRDTGRLMNSMTSRPTKDQVFIGTNLFYAATHQFGATINPSTKKHVSISGVMTKGAGFLAFKVPGGYAYTRKPIKIPARPFLPEQALPKDWSDAFVRNIQTYIKKAATPAK